MNFYEFQVELEECINSKLPKGYELTFCNTVKNNGVNLRGAVIRQEGCCIAPTIYINSFYDMYEDGEDINIIADKIINLSEKSRLDCDIDKSFFTSYEAVKDFIFVKLVNFKSNEALLMDVPYCRFLDLAIVMYCDVTEVCGISATILLKNEHLNMWGETKEPLLEYAIKNTRDKLGVSLFDLADFLCMNALVDNDIISGAEKLYILTNENKMFGASALLYEDVIKDFCEKNCSDAYILPSSIHEVIIISAMKNSQQEYLDDMVRSVNQELEFEDVLSDHAYYYSRLNGYEMI